MTSEAVFATDNRGDQQPHAHLDQAVYHESNSLAGMLAGKRRCVKRRSSDGRAGKHKGRNHAMWYTDMLDGSVDMIATPKEK